MQQNQPPKPKVNNESLEPIHDWFGLSYAQYLTIPRSALQTMSIEWQRQFVSCLEQLDAALDWRPAWGKRYYCKLMDEAGRVEFPDQLADYERGRRRIK